MKIFFIIILLAAPFVGASQILPFITHGLVVKNYVPVLDTIPCTLLITTGNDSVARAVDGYCVREVHSELERSIDWGMNHTRPPENYYVPVFYLDIRKKPFEKKTLIWQSKNK